MATIHLYDETDGSVSKFDGVHDAIAIGDDVRMNLYDGSETSVAGSLFKGDGVFNVYVDPFHGDNIEKHENIVDPVIMPGGTVTLNREDGVKITMRGEIMRMKVT